MKKFINTGQPVVMTTNRQPLTIQLSIKQRSGRPLTQTQDKVNSVWSPDRQTNALILDPVATAYDPDSGNTTAIPAENISWYIGSINATSSEQNETGLVTAIWSTSGNYYLEKTSGNNPVPTGSLVVRKNVNYDSPVTLICVVQFTDTSRAENYRVETSLILTATNMPDEFYSVRLKNPSVVEYRPLTDNSPLRTLTAVAYKGNDEVKAPFLSGIRFFWFYQRNGGAWTPIPTNGTYAPYVSGGNNGYLSSIVLNAECISHDTIKVMIATTPKYTAVASPTGNPSTNGYFELSGSTYVVSTDEAVVSGKTYYTLSSIATEPDCDALALCEVERVFPRIEAQPYCTGGSSVKPSDGDREYAAIISADGVDMAADKVSEYIRLNWKSKPTNSNTVTDRGWGEKTYIPASQLLKTGSVNVEVYPDLYLLSELDVLTDDSPGGSGLVTDDSGSASASDYHGYVVGRT